MPIDSLSRLQENLQRGLSVVTEKWNYEVRDWVTSVHATDIDDDGEREIIACSRDGRVYVLKGNEKGNKARLWRRVIGTKAWVGTAIGITPSRGSNASVRIIVGTRDGKIYALDKDGGIVGKDRRIYSLPRNESTDEEDPGKDAYWCDTGYVIRQIYADLRQTNIIIFGSEDRCVYALDYDTGEIRWRFPTHGWVRTVFFCDIDGDGCVEILAGSTDKCLYVLNDQGVLLNLHHMGYAINSVFATDIDNDGVIEILVATDEKKFLCLTPRLEEKWQAHCDKRLLSLYTTDVNGDGYDEIIAGSEDGHIYFFDAHGNILWRHNIGAHVYSVYACDVDNDGQVEIIAGSGAKYVHVLRVQLIKGLEEIIRSFYLLMGSPDPASLNLGRNVYALLLNILRDEVKQLTALKYISLHHVEQLLHEENFSEALSALLKLEQQQVQLLWRKNYGQVHTLGFGDISGGVRQEIVIGTDDGSIHTFTYDGHHLWEERFNDNQVISVQMRHIEHGRWEDVVVCSTDGHIHVIHTGKERERHSYYIDEWLSGMFVLAPRRDGPGCIIAGTEQKKLLIYDDYLQQPAYVIETPSGIKTIYMLPSLDAEDGQSLEILAGSIKNEVYAYTRTGELLWTYEAFDTVQSIYACDIDGDDQVEVIIGSEDRNIHVVDSRGHLRWRYYLPDAVSSIDAQDIDQDKRIEILATCADGYLYVFSPDGDLLWKYEVGDRIHVVHAADIDDDENVEIALGAEDGLELLQVVRPAQLHSLMQLCWQHIRAGQSFPEAISQLFETYDPMLHVFALLTLAEQKDGGENQFLFFDRCSKSLFSEVRKALVHTLVTIYPADPARARALLDQLTVDAASEVRLTVVEHALELCKHDWQVGLEYLERFADNSDRLVRRATIRNLHRLIDLLQAMSDVPHNEIRKRIFGLLIKQAKDEESEWVRQEAGRTLAHFLDVYNADLLVYLYLLIVHEVEEPIFQHIAHNAKTQVMQHVFQDIIPLLFGLNEENILERLERVVPISEEVRSLCYGEDTYLMYRELLRLLKLTSIEDIACYQCFLTSDQATSSNQHFPVFMEVIKRVSIVPRLLSICLRRNSLTDRLNSLLEAINATNRLHAEVDHAYEAKLFDIPMSGVPDRAIFDILLSRWRFLLLSQLNELRGHPELVAELRTRQVHREEQVAILLAVKNNGRSAANNLKVTLLSSPDFDVLSDLSCESEVLFSREEMLAEFTIKPLKPHFDLIFSIMYDDITTIQEQVFCDRLELHSIPQEFAFIPNPYSTGTPTHDKKMFYGRECDMAYLQDNLTRPLARTVLVLYGQRRSGKTTLLLQLNNSEDLNGHIPVLIDMQRVSYKISLSSLLYRIAFYIFQALKKQGLHTDQPLRDAFDLDPTFAFDQFLDAIEDGLEGQKLILLIDEFEVLEEQVKKGVLQPEIFEYLRSLMQHRQYMNFLLAGTHTIEQLTRGYWSVFFNIARHYHLGKLSADGAEDLIRKPVAGYLEYDPLAVQKIRQLTDDQPYLIHLICRALVDHCNDLCKSYVTINDVNIVLQEAMLTGQNHFGWIWAEQLTPQKRVLLSALAESADGRSSSLMDINEIYRRYRIPYVREQILASLKDLIEADIVENVADTGREIVSDGTRYRVPVGLIRQWLRKEKSLDQVRKEFQDV